MRLIVNHASLRATLASLVVRMDIGTAGIGVFGLVGTKAVANSCFDGSLFRLRHSKLHASEDEMAS